MSSVLVEQVLCRCCLFVVVCYAELAGKGPESSLGYIVSERLEKSCIFSEAFEVCFLPKYPTSSVPAL